MKGIVLTKDKINKLGKKGVVLSDRAGVYLGESISIQKNWKARTFSQHGGFHQLKTA